MNLHKFWLSAVFIGTLAARADYEGIVTKIIDGDTVYVNSNGSLHKVRFSGIDAPEHDQPYGYTSKNNLNNLILHKKIFVKTDKQDRYGRDLGYVFYDGLNINEVQVKEGLAWAYRFREKPSNPSFYRLELAARQGSQGLWRERNPVEPWKWRRDHRNNN